MSILSSHFNSRRMVLGLLSVAALTFLGYTKDMDVSMAIAAVVAAVAGANSFEAVKSKPTTRKVEDEDIK